MLWGQYNDPSLALRSMRGGPAFPTGARFDHGSDVNNGQLMGMINHARVAQKRWYFYRNLYLGIAPPTWPVSGTAAKLKLTTDRDTITDDGRSDAQLIVQVQDASGKWLSNSPNITLTDKSGLGRVPYRQLHHLYRRGGEKGVRNGQAAIEFRSYNAGAVTIKATSGSLTPASVTITVLHVPDNLSYGGAHSRCFAHCRRPGGNGGDRLRKPHRFAREHGRKKGRGIAVRYAGKADRHEPPSTCRVIVRPGAAEGIVIAKVKDCQVTNYIHLTLARRVMTHMKQLRVFKTLYPRACIC